MFIRVHTFVNAIKRLEVKKKFISPTKYFGAWLAQDILRNCKRYTHSANVCIIEFHINA